MFDAIGYAKQHPVTTGAIVIGGGFIFVLLSGWFTSGSFSSSSSGPSGPSDAIQAAQISAEAQLQGAQIAAGAAGAHDQASSNIALAYIAANKDITQSQNQAAIDSLKIQTQAQLQEDLINATANLALSSQQTNATVLQAAIKEHRDISLPGITLRGGAQSSGGVDPYAALLTSFGQSVLGNGGSGGSTTSTSTSTSTSGSYAGSYSAPVSYSGGGYVSGTQVA